MDKETVETFEQVMGEAIATQTLLIELMQEMARRSPSNIELVKTAINNAEDLLTDAAMTRGAQNPPGHNAAALKAISQLRSMLKLGN